MNTKPQFKCSEMRLRDENGIIRSISIHMDVEVGGKPLGTFVLDTGSMETGNRLAALLTEAVVDILPVWRHTSSRQLYG